MDTSVPALVSVDEYLNTVYHPDCDYIDGEVLERNMGEIPHGRLQSFFVRFFAAHEEEWQIEAVPETRLQVTEDRFRVPDVMVLPYPHSEERIVHTPAILCIEIFSSKDRMKDIQERVDDYSRMGVRASWVIDPWRELAYTAGYDGVLRVEADRLTVEGTPIEITVAEIWTELARLEKRAARRSANASA